MKKTTKKKSQEQLPAGYMCPYNPHNMDCNACGGEVCGQKEISQEEWVLRNHEARTK